LTSAARGKLGHFRRDPEALQPPGNPGGTASAIESVDSTTRKPLFLLSLFGLFLLRAAQRTLLSLLLNAPPRKTRCL